MFGCRGIAPMSVSRCTSAAALAAPDWAGVFGTGPVVDGAVEVAESVGLWGEDSVVLVEEDCAEGASGVSVGCCVIGADPGIAVTGAMGITGADMTGDTGLIGLTGDSTLVGFVTDLTQVLDDVTHGPQAGCP